MAGMVLVALPSLRTRNLFMIPSRESLLQTLSSQELS